MILSDFVVYLLVVACFATTTESAICLYIPGRNYTSASVIDSQIAVSPYACCKLCSEIIGCAAATYNSNTYKCVMVSDKSEFKENVADVTGILNRAVTTPPPTPPPANGNIGVLTCCLYSRNCSVISDSSCISYASECGKCVNGIPYHQGGAYSGYYWCPRYDQVLGVNNAKSYRYDCNNKTGLKIKVFTEPNCLPAAAPFATVATPWAPSCSQNQQGFSKGSVINGPATNVHQITQSSCYDVHTKCEDNCSTNNFVPGNCTYTRTGPNTHGYIVATYYKTEKKVTFGVFGADKLCKKPLHAMLVQPTDVCFQDIHSFSHIVRTGD